MRKFLLSFLVFSVAFSAKAQENFPVNGSHDIRPQKIALTHATVVTNAEKQLENALILMDGDQLEYVGKTKDFPDTYVEIDLSGKFVYPSFIEIFGIYGIDQPKKTSGSSWNSPQVFESPKKGAYSWNESLRAENKGYEFFEVDEEEAKSLQNIGFGAVQTFKHDGIARGSAALVSLARTNAHKAMLLPQSGAQYSFDKGTSKNTYPNSIMGSVALVRQALYDAQWYAQQKKDYNITLETLNKLQNLPQFFEAKEWRDLYRIDAIAQEFGKTYIVKSGGDEYQRLEEIKAMNLPLVVPLDFPKAPKVEDPLEAADASLSKLKHWEMAPANPALLEQAGMQFALTAYGLKSKKDFWKNLRKAMEYGLSEKQVLRSLTEIPAKLLKVEDRLGSLEKGKLANLLVVDKPIFEKDARILENWVQGNRYILTSANGPNLAGTYEMTSGGKLKLEGSPASYKAKIEISGDSLSATFKQEDKLFSLWYTPKNQDTPLNIQGYVEDGEMFTLNGKNHQADGSTEAWSAKQTETSKSGESTKKDTAKKPEIGKRIFPFMAYGNEEIPKAVDVLFKNVTAWTNEEEGILEEVDVLLKNGKIEAIGKNLSAGKNTLEIDGTGKHLTPGIIDEHSHIALGSVNESAQAVTAEVRMSDALLSDHINIYRQLAGGVTTSQLLHGSANPIGGQAVLIKLRWGKDPEGLKFGGNDGFIKFALGENVKQSNWGINGIRFPQTRMGVEQVFIDAFTRAWEYKNAKERGDKNLRKDLELETLVEILDEKRFITCHSYVQSEINMLMEVADQMKFKVNTFTHILEGYKLADKMAERGIAGSTFSDWWAYKIEVADAIPYNAHLMNKVGVLTAINSDDAEMGRRLNQEAGKVVKYGGTSEEEAFKMVTLNPAKMLHIDHRVGSLKKGKDADVVLWSDHPLSIYAVAEQTYVDGVKYWDVAENEEKLKAIEKERSRIIEKIRKESDSGGKSSKKDKSDKMVQAF